MRDRCQDHVHGDLAVDELAASDLNARLDAARQVRDLDPARASADVLPSPALVGRPVLNLYVLRLQHGPAPFYECVLGDVRADNTT
jgi:hypothetical protein